MILNDVIQTLMIKEMRKKCIFFSLYISREKGDHYYILNTAQGFFFPLESYSKKTLRKNVPKSARKYKRNVLMPPGHPIVVLKSN